MSLPGLDIIGETEYQGYLIINAYDLCEPQRNIVRLIKFVVHVCSVDYFVTLTF